MLTRFIGAQYFTLMISTAARRFAPERRSAKCIWLLRTKSWQNFWTAWHSAVRDMREAATRAIGRILDVERVTVHRQSRDSFLAGLRFYEQRPDKGYSLVDCVSMTTMRRQGVAEVLTNHRHFAQEGFKVLLR